MRGTLIGEERLRHYGQYFIDGAWVDPIEARTFELVNPATEEVYATVSLGSAADVDRAVRAAREALPAFPERPEGSASSS